MRPVQDQQMTVVQSITETAAANVSVRANSTEVIGTEPQEVRKQPMSNICGIHQVPLNFGNIRGLGFLSPWDYKMCSCCNKYCLEAKSDNKMRTESNAPFI